jgi:hypothetical protein
MWQTVVRIFAVLLLIIGWLAFGWLLMTSLTIMRLDYGLFR